MNVRKRIAMLAACMLAGALAVCCLAGCGGDKGTTTTSASGDIYRTLDSIKESGTINIGVFSDKNPFGYVDENGEYQGYDIELARQIGEDLGVKVELVSTEPASRIEYLQTGKVDIVLANFTVTDERKQEVDFAEAYMNVALGAVSHKDNVITSIDAVTDDTTVMVISGTTAETYLTKNYPSMKLQKFDTYAACKTAFENDKNALWVNDNTEVIAFANTANATGDGNEYVVGIEELGSLDTIAPAVSKGNDTLLSWLNDEMVSLGAQNFFHSDYDKTLTSTYGASYKETLVIEPGQK